MNFETILFELLKLSPAFLFLALIFVLFLKMQAKRDERASNLMQELMNRQFELLRNHVEHQNRVLTNLTVAIEKLTAKIEELLRRD